MVNPSARTPLDPEEFRLKVENHMGHVRLAGIVGGIVLAGAFGWLAWIATTLANAAVSTARELATLTATSAAQKEQIDKLERRLDATDQKVGRIIERYPATNYGALFATGQLVRASASQIVVVLQGEEKTYALAADAQFRVDGKPVAARDLKLGAPTTIELTADGAKAVKVSQGLPTMEFRMPRP